jgi:hypothetical protein
MNCPHHRTHFCKKSFHSGAGSAHACLISAVRYAPLSMRIAALLDSPQRPFLAAPTSSSRTSQLCEAAFAQSIGTNDWIQPTIGSHPTTRPLMPDEFCNLYDMIWLQVHLPGQGRGRLSLPRVPLMRKEGSHAQAVQCANHSAKHAPPAIKGAAPTHQEWPRW